MAIQAQMYQENLGLPLIGSQDWLFMHNNNQNNFNNNLSNTNNNNNNNNSNNNMSFNGCGYNEFIFSNNIQQQKQLQQHEQQEVLLQLEQEYYLLQNQQQRNNNNDDDLVFLSSSKNNCASTTTASTTTTTTMSDYHIPLNFSPCFVEQLEKQRQEIDRFITLQNERLKMALQEQRKQQLSTIMRKLEAKTMQILTQKDEEIARATKRTIELEDIITKLEIETQEWQRSATENEAMVVSLNNTLEQLKEPICCSTSSSSSCCNNVVNNNVGVFNNKEKGGVLCKVCKSEKCCILMLPCRHLCCCKGCEPFVDACPVCKAAKMASIEALIS